MSNEADAQIIIDRALREADWSIEDKFLNSECYA